MKKILVVDCDIRLTIKGIKDHPWYSIISPIICEGILTNQVVLPVDEDIVEKMVAMHFSKEEIRSSVISNKHNHISTTYYLLVKVKIKKGIPSPSDMLSDLYFKYISDPANLLTQYEGDITRAVEERSSSKGKYLDPERKLSKKSKKQKKIDEFEEMKQINKEIEMELKREIELERQREKELGTEYLKVGISVNLISATKSTSNSPPKKKEAEKKENNNNGKMKITLKKITRDSALQTFKDGFYNSNY